MKLLQVDFTYPNLMGSALSQGMIELANSINEEAGLIWKIWTEQITDKRGGGVYLFDSEANAERYLRMHSARLQTMGASDIRGIIFDVNLPLTQINQGPVFQEGYHHE